jgi:predicted secreted Zn-dependent protease
VKSWGLLKTSYILAHEQGHFDITEIFARKLHRELLKYKFSRRTFRQDVNLIYDRVVKEKEAFQEAYDGQTDHSRNKKLQQEWLERIDRILEDTAPYANYP